MTVFVQADRIRDKLLKTQIFIGALFEPWFCGGSRDFDVEVDDLLVFFLVSSFVEQHY